MCEIILISSFHISIGKCNSKELYSIINKIQPEVIFEELDHETFNFIYREGNKPQTIEAISIKKYLETFKIDHYPVDTYKFNIIDSFQEFDKISNHNTEYNKLFIQHLNLIIEHGYSFINSNEFTEMLETLKNIEKNTLLEINNSLLLAKYIKHLNLIEKREIEMLRNIYNYIEIKKYKKALFICGVQHRKSIYNIIPEFEANTKVKINWTFYQ